METVENVLINVRNAAEKLEQVAATTEDPHDSNLIHAVDFYNDTLKRARSAALS